MTVGMNNSFPTLRFPKFEGKLTCKQLKHITSYVDYRGKGPEKVDSGVFLVTAKNIKKGFIDYTNSREFVHRENYALVMRKGLPLKGDVLFTTEAPLGNVALVDDPNIALAQRVIKFRGTPGVLLGTYLMNYMLSAPFQRTIRKKSIGTTVQGISGSELHRITIAIPSLEEQQRVAEYFSSVETRIQQLSQKKTLLERWKKGLMQQLFNQTIRFKDDDGNDFPDWEEKKLGSVCDCFSGGTPTSSNRDFYGGSIPFIRSAEIASNSTALFLTEEGLKESSAKLVVPGDLLVALYGANSGEVGVSRINGAINQAVLCLRTSQSANFLYYWLEYSKQSIVETFLQGGQGNLSGQIIKSLKVQFPDVEEQTKIANCLSAIDKKIEAVGQQIEKTKTFKQGLLQQMFV